MIQKISIIGLGFVGSSMYDSFLLNNIKNISVYDKFKNGGIGSFKKCLRSDIMFLCLPTLFNEEDKCYDKSSILETCLNLEEANYNGIIIIKSTIEPGTCSILSDKFSNLKIIHNPEFLSAKSALNDFHNQKHIVLGKGKNCTNEDIQEVEDFYKKYYNADISICSSHESESMKIFCNSFYSIKIQFFTELYLLCQKNGTDFDTVRDLMLKNDWINPMHTKVPGPDGNISYGGLCFPKDTNALNEYMKKNNTPNSILDSCIKERDVLRENIITNIIKKYTI